MTGPLPRWVIAVPALVSAVLAVVELTADLPPGVHLALIAAQLLCLTQAVALWRHDRHPTRPDTGPYSGVPAK